MGEKEQEDLSSLITNYCSTFHLYIKKDTYCHCHFTPEINHAIRIATLLECSVNFNGTSTYIVYINEKKIQTLSSTPFTYCTQSVLRLY